jgi:GNAT superfamily N-acetyltransferase
MSKVSVRAAVLGDSDAIAYLMTQLGYPTTAEAMSTRLTNILADPDYITFVAESAQGIVGVVGISIGRLYEKDGLHGQLLALVVDETYRGQGVGARLVAEAERWLKKCRAQSVVVGSGTQRHDAHHFYRQLGYKQTGLRFAKRLSE